VRETGRKECLEKNDATCAIRYADRITQSHTNSSQSHLTIDVSELFSCCVAHIDDELAIDREIRPLLDYLYAEGQRADAVVADSYRGQGAVSHGAGNFSAGAVQLLRSRFVIAL
jgi:hypothetical protein